MLAPAVTVRRPGDGLQGSRRADFPAALETHGIGPLKRAALQTLQVNLGRLCNQACEHCHVDAGPKRREIMTRETMTRIVDWCRVNAVLDVDLTGGAPEMNPGFRWFVDALLGLGLKVTSRCNLTILMEPGQRDLADWYAARKVALICSLPCYSEANVDGQRGKGVFEKSIAALRELNAAGYGKDPVLTLDLVYNPAGAFLPPDQDALERDYKRELDERFGIAFNRLLALANLPINRFSRFLENNGLAQGYMDLLVDSFNADTVPNLMCRRLLSVDWRGFLYDCDFNQMLDLPLGGRRRLRLWEISARELAENRIGVGSHCFGCTAGAGSSCGGSLD